MTTNRYSDVSSEPDTIADDKSDASTLRGFSVRNRIDPLYDRTLSLSPPPLQPSSLLSSATPSYPRRCAHDWQLPPNNFIVKIARDLGISLKCRECLHRGKPDELVLCSGCGISHEPVHRECLLYSRRHRNMSFRSGPSTPGQRCEEVDFREYVFTRTLLRAPAEKHMLRLHAEDIFCSWIGIPVFQEGEHPEVHVWPRLHQLLTHAEDPPGVQHPSLVSFVGDTGSGKSTLIRAMIRMSKIDSGDSISVPLPGLPTNRFVSTSSDIHVYADPVSISTDSPIFFVDCEGFAGSENPAAVEVVERLAVPQSLYKEEGGSRGQTAREYRRHESDRQEILQDVEKFLDSAGCRAKLEWGRFQVPDPDSSTQPRDRPPRNRVRHDTRRQVVKKVYPRILYAFSDVVCFVTSNGRNSDIFLSKLIDWATEGHDRVLNQRIKPALLIVLNKDPILDSNGDVFQDPTRELLQSFEHTSQFQALKILWKERGRTIQTAEDALLCYYSSFKAIVIPAFTVQSLPIATALVSRSIKELYERIQESIRNISQAKLCNNSGLNVTKLDKHLNKSLEMLGKDLRAALDLHDDIEDNSRIPTTFGGHMAATLRLLQRLRRRQPKNRGWTSSIIAEQQLVDDLTPYVAACIATQLPWNSNEDIRAERVDKMVDEALRGLIRFQLRDWRCEARDEKERRCRNYADSHEKGHQFTPSEQDPDFGKVMIHRPSKCSHICSWDPQRFKQELFKRINELQSREMALERLTHLAKRTNIVQVQTQLTCLVCLSRCPTNMLPCQGGHHGICQVCLERFSRKEKGGSSLRIDSCPLGCALDRGCWNIRVKPDVAGPRVLALDGGGVRGLVELFIINAIEKEVGYNINIDELFDLVIGTSTGGIIGLGIFHQGAPPSISEFQTLAKRSFILRRSLGIPIVKNILRPFYESRYTETGIEDALQRYFGSKKYLFAPSSSGSDWVKVGVVTCLQGQNRPILVANYSRDSVTGEDEEDYLWREEEKSRDFKVWEAARATSAAPLYFPPFRHSRNKDCFVDGGIVCNNPIGIAYEEVNKIWPNSLPPDILVSVGTGVAVDLQTGEIKPPSKPSSVTMLLPRGLRKQLELAQGMVRNTLDSHKAWTNFRNNVPVSPKIKRNFHRLNVGLTQKVNLADVDKMGQVVQDCTKYLEPDANLPYFNDRYPTAYEHIKVVSRRLLASLFYYIGDLGETMAAGQVRGEIYCRLDPGSTSATSLLRDKPRFRLRQIDRAGKVSHCYIKYTSFDQRDLYASVLFKVRQGDFHQSIEVNVKNWGDIWEPISGFA